MRYPGITRVKDIVVGAQNKYFLKTELFPSVYRKYEITERSFIGRGEKNNIVLPDNAVSSEHALVALGSDGIWIEDCDSSNGTIVNEVVVHKRYLEDNDHILIGSTSMWLKVYTTAEESVDLEENLQDYLDEEDVTVNCPNDSQSISALCDFIQEKLGTISNEKFFVAVTEALQNAYVHGNKKDPDKSILCRVMVSKNSVAVEITDEGEGFVYEPFIKAIFAKAQESIKTKGMYKIVEGTQEVEYNTKGNQITLLEKLEEQEGSAAKPEDNMQKMTVLLNSLTTPEANETNAKKGTTSIHDRTRLMQKNVSVFYNSQLGYRESTSFHIAFTSKAVKEFPFDIDKQVFLHPSNFSKRAHMIRIIPVFPGAICVPPFRDIDANQPTNRVEFIITALSFSKESSGWIELERSGKTIYCKKIPFLIHRNSSKFLWSALLVSLVYIFTQSNIPDPYRVIKASVIAWVLICIVCSLKTKVSPKAENNTYFCEAVEL